MAPKKVSSSANGETSIGRVVGRGAKSASLGGPLMNKKAAAAPIAKAKEMITPVGATYTKEQLALVEGRPDLEPDSKSYNALWDDVKNKMGMPKNAPSE